MKPINGTEIWRGPSRINGAPIVAIATWNTANPKTGNMVQVWILPQEEEPHQAVKSGADASVCGDCPLRPLAPGNGPKCYVSTFQAPLAVHRKWARGGYPIGAPLPEGVPVRLGTYGEPSALPVAVLRRLTRTVRHTGYTHQWGRFPSLRPLVMASVESLEGAREAWAKGWRTFRVVAHPTDVSPSEILCPATTHGTTCADCGLCNGAGSARSIAIVAH